MTRERAKELLPIITAYANGETIEVKQSTPPWRESIDPQWDDDLEYRIKPKSVTITRQDLEKSLTNIVDSTSENFVKICEKLGL